MEAPIDPRQLQQFLALLRARSFRVAAEQLGISQSTLTRSLQRLERSLGCKLFDRTTRTVAPTPAAEQLRARAEEALRGLSAFVEEASVIAGGTAQTLRLGVIALAAESLVAPALARLGHSNPDTRVEVVVGSADVYGDLVAGQCDVVIADQANFELSPYAQSLRMQRIRAEPLVAVYAATHPEAAEPTLAALLDYPWAIPSRYFAENSTLQGLASRVPAGSFPRYKMTNLAACLALARQSNVVTLAPEVVARGEAVRGLHHHDLGLGLQIRLALFTLARLSPSAAVRAFQGAVLAVASQAT